MTDNFFFYIYLAINRSWAKSKQTLHLTQIKTYKTQRRGQDVKKRLLYF